MAERPRVLICCNTTVREGYVAGEGLARLDALADWEWLPSEGTSTRPGVWGGPSDEPADHERLRDTTHGSSLPVAEWALGLMLVGLRNASVHYRRLIAGEEYRPNREEDAGWRKSELSDAKVGLIGLGHIGRRLTELLRPFRCRISCVDPYLPKEVALAVGVTLTSLDHVMADSDVVVCCAPLTPKTRRMIGAPG